MARCRRPAPRAPAGAPAAKAPPRFVLAPGIEVDAFEANVIETIHRVEQYLFEVGLMPMVALCDDAPRITALPPPAKERIHLLLRAAGRDVDMTYLEESTFRVLREATEPRTAEQIAGRLGPGAPLAATRNALETLAGEGILVRLP